MSVAQTLSSLANLKISGPAHSAARDMISTPPEVRAMPGGGVLLLWIVNEREVHVEFGPDGLQANGFLDDEDTIG